MHIKQTYDCITNIKLAFCVIHKVMKFAYIYSTQLYLNFYFFSPILQHKPRQTTQTHWLLYLKPSFCTLHVHNVNTSSFLLWFLNLPYLQQTFAYSLCMSQQPYLKFTVFILPHFNTDTLNKQSARFWLNCLLLKLLFNVFSNDA